MADITGYYEFHRDCPAKQLTIQAVGGAGDLEFASIDRPIHGHYNATTNAITFNDAWRPGEIIWVTYYTGYAMPTGDGGVCAMAGTWQELRLEFDGDRIVIETVHGSWYAIWQGEIIG